MGVDVEQLQVDVKAVRLILFGNGQPGLAEDVRNLKGAVDEVATDVINFASDMSDLKANVAIIQRVQDADRNQREGARKMLALLGSVLALISAGGALMTARVLDVLSQLANLP